MFERVTGERTCAWQSHGATETRVLAAREAAAFSETTADYELAEMESEHPGALQGSAPEMEQFASVPERAQTHTHHLFFNILYIQFNIISPVYSCKVF